MPIDPNIALATRPPVIDSPVKTMTELYGMQNQREEIKGRQLLNAERDLDNQKKTRDAADDAAIRQELSNSQTGPDGQLDVPGAIDRLHKGGHGTAGMKLTQQWTDHLQKQAATSEAEIKRHSADLEMGARLFAGVKDDETLATAKQMLGSGALGPDSAKIVDGLPDTYAEAKPKIDLLLEAGNKMADKLRAAQDSIKDHQYALEHGMIKPDATKGEQEPPSVTESREKANVLMTSSVGRMLATTDNDAEYQQQLKAFKSQGYPADILNKFDTVWSPKAVQKAKSLTMTPKESEDLRLEGRRVSTGEKNAETSAQREKRESETGPRPDPWHANDMQEYNAARSEFDKTQPPASQKVQVGIDPTTGKTKAMPVKRGTFDTFEDWRRKVKGRDASGKPLEGPAAPSVAAPAPSAPPAGVAPTPPPQSPSLGANVRPQAPGAPTPPPQAQPPAGTVPQAKVPPAVGGVRVKLPPDKDHPQGRVVRFKDKASADAFAKAAGFTFTQ